MAVRRYRVTWGRWSFEDEFENEEDLHRAIQEAADEIESAVNVGVAEVRAQLLGYQIVAELDVGDEHQEVFLLDDGVDVEPESPLEFVSTCPVGFTQEGAECYVASLSHLHPTADFRFTP